MTAGTSRRYHSDQAQLAAQTVGNAGLHTYHATRRERAARVIQGYLQRQQATTVATGAAGDMRIVVGGAEEGALVAGDGGDEAPVYSREEMELLRRAQRAFREHLRKQNVEAEEILHETLHAYAGDRRRSADGVQVAPGQAAEVHGRALPVGCSARSAYGSARSADHGGHFLYRWTRRASRWSTSSSA